MNDQAPKRFPWRIKVLEGGLMRWVKLGYPVETG
jgi:hypothetical protein